MTKLKEYRLSRSLSQSSVAKYLNVTQQQYSRFESGLSVLNVDQLSILCELYKVTPNELLDIKKIYNNIMSKLDK